MPAGFVYKGVTTNVAELLKETDASTLLVLKDGKVYWSWQRLSAIGGL